MDTSANWRPLDEADPVRENAAASKLASRYTRASWKFGSDRRRTVQAGTSRILRFAPYFVR